ncbi:MAG TPA: hypothetical protein VGH48_00980, partial [Caldimonas sp.]
MNLSHHDYFNLAGSGSSLEQSLTLAASRYLPSDPHLFPGGIANVAGTPSTFASRRRSPRASAPATPSSRWHAVTT